MVFNWISNLFEGVQENFWQTVLIHESSRLWNMVVYGMCILHRFHNTLDSCKILSQRMARNRTMRWLPAGKIRRSLRRCQNRQVRILWNRKWWRMLPGGKTNLIIFVDNMILSNVINEIFIEFDLTWV